MAETLIAAIAEGIAWEAAGTTVAGYAAAYAVAYTATSAVLYMAGNALLTAASRHEQGGTVAEAKGRQIMVRSAVEPRRLVYGRCRVSGPLVYAGTTGTDNEFLHLVIPVAGHPIDGFEAFYLNDTPILLSDLDADGNVTTGPHAGFLRLRYHDGTQTAVDPVLAAEDPLWDSTHVGYGVPYLYARLKFDRQAWPTGLPNIAALLRGKRLYDPRTGLTAWSSNWALCVRDYLASTQGLRATNAEIDDSTFIAAANICDEAVALSSGTQVRYDCHGTVNTSQKRAEIIDRLLTAGAGTLVYSQGRYKLFAAAYRAPLVTLSENDLAGPLKIVPRITRRELYNAIRGTYVESVGYQPVDFPPVRNATYAAEDGEEIFRDLELPFTTDPTRAQRLSKILLERSRQTISVSFSAKLTAFKLQAFDNVRLSIASMGWVNKEFLITGWQFGQNGQIQLTLQEEAAGIYAWNNGLATTYDLAPNTNFPNPLIATPIASLTVTSTANDVLRQADGTILPRLHVAWTLPSDAFIKNGGRVEVQLKKSADSAWAPLAAVSGDATQVYSGPVVSAMSYDVRARTVNTLGKTSLWTYSNNTVAAWIVPSAGGKNLLYNSSFEVDSDADNRADGWAVYAPATTVTASFVAGRTGARAQSLTWTGLQSGTVALTQGTFALKARTWYTLSWYARATGGIGDVGAVYGLEGLFTTNPDVFEWIVNPGPEDASGEFKRWAARFQVPADQTATLAVGVNPGTGASGARGFALDDVMLTEGETLLGYAPSVDEILPGAVKTDMIDLNAVSQSVSSFTPGVTSLSQTGETVLGSVTLVTTGHSIVIAVSAAVAAQSVDPTTVNGAYLLAYVDGTAIGGGYGVLAQPNAANAATYSQTFRIALAAGSHTVVFIGQTSTRTTSEPHPPAATATDSTLHVYELKR